VSQSLGLPIFIQEMGMTIISILGKESYGDMDIESMKVLHKHAHIVFPLGKKHNFFPFLCVK
jgi:hypothetical protein